MFKAILVTGFHGAGKTKLVVSIIEELVKRGYRVGTVKHIPEKDFTIDRTGKDTWAHAKAGAELVVSLAPGEVAWIEKRSAELGEILSRLTGVNFVIVEGFKSFSGLARVVVARDQQEAEKLVDDLTIACVGSSWPSVPSFNFEQIKEIVDLIERRSFPPLFTLDCGRCGFDSCEKFAAALVSGEKRWEECQALADRVVLKVDGSQLPLKPFVQEILAGVIKGMVGSLKGSRGKSIEIKVTDLDG
ncbi:MAG: molybdopterin-guanine dinucleotide biosynthesis protein B [Hadesarchaea archaeon]|nr:molybdopterin-guanine dinucleotide biosynthesis protein B [Hadesarchaea archaeon]